jgi:MFS family permease
MMALVGMLAYEFQVTLPVVAKQTFHGGSATYGFLTAAMGVGAVLGGLVTAARGRTGLRHFTLAGSLFGVAIALAASAPVLAVELVALTAVGWASVTFIATGNTTLQLQAEPTMRGRVMALWAVAFQGTTPVGGPLIGWVVAMGSARIGLGVGAVACLVAAGLGLIAMAKLGTLRGRSRSSREFSDREGPVAEAPLGLVTEGD